MYIVLEPDRMYIVVVPDCMYIVYVFTEIEQN